MENDFLVIQSPVIACTCYPGQEKIRNFNFWLICLNIPRHRIFRMTFVGSNHDILDSKYPLFIMTLATVHYGSVKICMLLWIKRKKTLLVENGFSVFGWFKQSQSWSIQNENFVGAEYREGNEKKRDLLQKQRGHSHYQAKLVSNKICFYEFQDSNFELIYCSTVLSHVLSSYSIKYQTEFEKFYLIKIS